LVLPANCELLQYEADTEQVEARIPMEFRLDNHVLASGELYHSGEYYCLCPTDQSVDLSYRIDPQITAVLSVDPYGQVAILDINGEGQ
jgi:hypothetical protein